MNLDRTAIKERVEMVQQLAQSIRKDMIAAYVASAREIIAKAIKVGLKPSVAMIMANIEPEELEWLEQADFIRSDLKIVDRLRGEFATEIYRAMYASHGGAE